MIYRTQEEINRLAIDTGNGANASISTNRLSDLRVAQFGTARRSEIAAQIGSTRWHDAWEAYLREQEVNNSKYIEEERSIFHRTKTY